MNILFIGPQGSGKGTQAKIIAEKIGIAHISSGDLLRNAQGELKKEIDSYIIKGSLVPDKLMIKLISERIKQPDCKSGFILDGFPRNIEQAKQLDKTIKLDKVIEISISDAESIKRLSGRWNCKKCGAIYNLNTSPKPKKPGICDKCGSPISQREDDKEDAIKKRLEIYHKETEPILKNYPSVKIKGEQSIEKVNQEILNVLK